MARIDELRLMTRVARMYYEQGLRQTEIMNRLNMSQSTISRLLKRAEKAGVGHHESQPLLAHARVHLKERLLATSMLDGIGTGFGNRHL